MTRPTPHRPAEILTVIIVTLLAPMFIAATGGDLNLARAAALETIDSYRAHNHASLMAVAKIVAFGLAALGSLSLSMEDDVPILLILRLRGNANALERSADRAERALQMMVRQPYAGMGAQDEEDYDEAEVRASVAEAQRRAAEFRARTATRESRPEPTPAAAAPGIQPAPAVAATRTQPVPAAATPRSQPAPATVAASPRPEQARAPAAAPRDEHTCRSMWAAAMAHVAAEEVEAAANLPPAQRQQATERAAILSSTANTVLSGAPAEPSAAVYPPGRIRPGGR